MRLNSAISDTFPSRLAADYLMAVQSQISLLIVELLGSHFPGFCHADVGLEWNFLFMSKANS